MRAEHDRAEFAVARHALKGVPVVLLERIAKLPEQVPQKARVGYDRNAFLGTRIEPLEELHGPVAATIVRLPGIAVEDVLIVPHLREVKIRKLRRDFGDGSPPVADVVPPPLPAFLADQDARCRDANARGMLWGSRGRLARIQEGRRPRNPGPAKDVARRLAGSGERGDHYQIEGREGASAGGPICEDLLETLGLVDAQRGEPAIVEGMVDGGGISPEEAVVVARLARCHIVVALGVADKMDLLRAAGKEYGESGGRRAERILEAIIQHSLRNRLDLGETCRRHD